MRITRRNSKLVAPLIVSIIANLSLAPIDSYADHVVRTCREVDRYHCEPPYIVKETCLKCSVIHPKKHIKKHHVKKHRVYRKAHFVPVCDSRMSIYDDNCNPQHEFVEFIKGPAPCGCYVDLCECNNYAPDRITGDDDPMIYPGMDIDE